MLKFVIELISFVEISFLEVYVIKKILKKEEKLFSIKNLIMMGILTVIPMLLYEIDYTAIYSIILYLISIICCKEFFNVKVPKAIILVSMYMLLITFADIIETLLFIGFLDINAVRSSEYIQLLLNSLTIVIVSIICNIKKVMYLCTSIVDRIENSRIIKTLLMFFLSVLVSILVIYNISNMFHWNIEYLLSIITVSIVITLIMIFMREKDNYNKLSDEYDNLFTYIHTFEEWIEREQLNRHEYKNQLAAIRMISSEKKVKDKIDEIINDNINIDNDTVNQLKTVPNGGLKGLLYYKMTVAKNKKVKLTVDVSINKKTILKKTDESKMKIICKLVGIYFDNAIEAALETRKKNVMLEMYEFDNKLTIVISNTFNKNKNISKRGEKGFSTKGKDRGNGLYFAKKLINKNSWLEEEQDIIDKYYIQKLIIKKETVK